MGSQYPNQFIFLHFPLQEMGDVISDCATAADDDDDDDGVMRDGSSTSLNDHRPDSSGWMADSVLRLSQEWGDCRLD